MNAWNLKTSSKRRDKLHIIAEILEIAKDGTLKTRIMYKANLSFAQLNEYLHFMLKINLMEKMENEGKEFYIATNKGLDFLERESEIAELLKDNDGHPKNGAKSPPATLLRKGQRYHFSTPALASSQTLDR